MAKIDDFIKIVNWLDEARWPKVEGEYKKVIEKNWIFKDESSRKLLEKSKDKAILVHWISYICNKQRNFRTVFDNCTPIFSEILIELIDKEVNDPKGILKIVKEFRYIPPASLLEKKDKKITPLKEKNGKKSFAFRDWGEFYGFLRTLTYFFSVDNQKKFIEILTEGFNKINFKEDEDSKIKEAVDSMAKNLFFISYWQVSDAKSSKTETEKHGYLRDWWQDKKCGEEEKLIELINKELKEEDNIKFEKNRCHKRLWAALRDYFKFNGPLYQLILKDYNEFFKGYDLKKSIKILKHFEFPGDIWNTRFCSNVIPNLIQDVINNGLFKDSIKTEIEKKLSEKGKISFPEIIRLFYTGVDKLNESDFYPEKLDFSFNFASRMCDRGADDTRICSELCVFNNPSKLKFFCREEDKLCPVVLYCGGYIIKCEDIAKAKWCPIKENVEEVFCKGNNRYGENLKKNKVK